MRRDMKKTCSLILRHYAARLINLNKYLESFLGVNLTDKVGLTEVNKIILNNMPNSWSKQAYVQGFDCESITFKKAVNMFESMKISESIYEVVLEPSYKKHTQSDSNHACHSRQKRG